MNSARFARILGVLATLLLGCSRLGAWDAPGHQIINQLALAALPPDFPDFVKAPDNAGRITFLAGEPDRWSHSGDLVLKHDNWLDHFLDMEQIPEAGMSYDAVPSFRYDFATAFAAARAAHPDKFPPIDHSTNPDHTFEWPGFLPWTITEHYGMLKAAFASLKAYEQAGTREEIANAQADVAYIMGIMGHYVGDSSQPLHDTDEFNGWTGPNPKGYTTDKIHTWIDSGFIDKAGMKTADILPRVKVVAALTLAARPDGRDPVFVNVFSFMLEQNKLVEPLYQMEKDGKLSRQASQPVTPEGRAFIEGQLLKGGEMLATLWETAWETSSVDSFLLGRLQKRTPAK